jgi:hypothetical protein
MPLTKNNSHKFQSGELVTATKLNNVNVIQTDNTANNEGFTGEEGQITYDTEKKVLLVHDGVTAGGLEVKKSSDSSISGSDIPSEAITEGKISNGAVTTSKISDGAISTGKIANTSVTTAKIAGDAVTSEKIADDAVTSDHLATDSVTSDSIASGSVGTNKIADNAVTDDKLSASGVVAGNYTNTSITVNEQGRITSAENGSGGGGASGLPTTFVSVNKTLQGSQLSMSAGSLRGYHVYVTSGTSYPNKTDGTTGTRTNFNSSLGSTSSFPTTDFVVTGIPDEARYWQFRANISEGRLVDSSGNSYFDSGDNGFTDGVFVVERKPTLINQNYRIVTSGIISMNFTLPEGESPHWVLSPNYVFLTLAQNALDENNYVINSLSFDGYWL